MRTQFNPGRLIPLDLHGEQQQITVTDMIPLRAALESNQLHPNTPVLYTERNDTPLVFQTRHFSLYNVMQGAVGGEAWMATFCAICNAGMSFSPVLDGVRYDFYGAGFYDAMTLLADKQTGSYWDHVTGTCVAGKMEGARLQQLSSMTHSKAANVGQLYPDAKLVISSLDAGRAPLDDLVEGLRTSAKPEWLPALGDSIDPVFEDQRLPRLEMGLGVWTPNTKRFYVMTTIYAHNNMIFDVIDGERLLVYIDPETLTPAALFTDATSGRWRGETLVLNNGERLQNSMVSENGNGKPVLRPLQLFQRWYGFSLTFPGCEIYRSRYGTI